MRTTRRGLFGLGIGAGVMALVGKGAKPDDAPTAVLTNWPNGVQALGFSRADHVHQPSANTTAWATSTWGDFTLIEAWGSDGELVSTWHGDLAPGTYPLHVYRPKG